MPLRVIVITGTPGVGKSTVANVLVSRLDSQYISVGDLVKKENLIVEADEKRDTIVADMRKLRTRLRTILKKADGDIILDGHYVYDVIPKAIEPFVFVLRRDPIRLEAILKERGYDEKKIYENLAAEALDVCLIGALKRFGPSRVDEIDATYMSVEAVVDEILAVLGGEKEMKVGKVDWLGKLEEEGTLEPFLSKIKGVGECETRTP
jgi:adenylate kinase